MIEVFLFSFITALSGAMNPGPLLTYTIIKSIQRKEHGYIIGFLVIIGHAILEMGLILLLLLGFSFIFKNDSVVLLIGVVGSLFLIGMGLKMIMDIKNKKISVDFLEEKENEEEAKKEGLIKNPIFGGILISASNPYWWIWWATIGFAFMTQYNISLQNWNIVAFFLGHELGDLLWYLLVAVLVSMGKTKLDRKKYYTVLFLCGLFMIGFGLYLGTTIIMQH